MKDKSKNRSMIDLLNHIPYFFRTRLSFFMHGSMTIEAALGLPMLMFFSAVILAPLRVMDAQRMLQNTLEAAAKDMSMAAYVAELSEDMLSDRLEDAGGLTGSIYEIVSAADLLFRLSKADGDVLEHMSIAEASGALDDTSEETGDGELIYYRIRYEPSLPLGALSISQPELTSVVNRRKWTGSEGGRGRSKYGDSRDEEGYDLDDDGDRVVYVGKNGTRYHMDRHCHYIDNVMTPVPGDRVEELRNSSGARYHACPSCDAVPEGTVYIFESGTSYHSSEECKAIGSYAKACKLSEAEHLGPCSYCSRKDGS